MTMDLAKLERQRALVEHRKAVTAQGVLERDPATVTLKQAAQAYACAAKGSEREAKLLDLLRWKLGGARPLVAGSTNPASGTESGQ